MKSYRDLRVWQKAMDLVPMVYSLAKLLPPEELYALSSQIRRAAVSIPANIAEGYARQHRKEYLQHLSIARGSLAELETLLLTGQRLGYLTAEQLEAVGPTVVDLRMLLHGLIRSLRAKS